MIDNKTTPAMGIPISRPVVFVVVVGLIAEAMHLETLYEYGEGDMPEHVMAPPPSLTHIAAPWPEPQ